MTSEYRLEGLSVPEELDRLQDLLERAAADHPEVSSTDLIMFETAVVEIAGNVVQHGRPQGEVRWEFRLQVLPDRLDACLSDGGAAFEHVAATEMPDEEAESGRGMPLAAAALDRLEYSRIFDVNHWEMVRLRR